MSSSTSQTANARLGLWLFFMYSLFYFGFVVVCAFAPSWSAWELTPGLNLAIVWGFALIAVAFVLALVYGLACKTDTVPANTVPANTVPTDKVQTDTDAERSR